MPVAQSTSLENCPFPHVASLNEDDGWLRRSLKPSIVSRLVGCHSRVKGEPPAELLYVHASIGAAAIAVGALIALCALATKVLTSAEEVVGEAGLLRLAAVLIQAGAR